MKGPKIMERTRLLQLAPCLVAFMWWGCGNSNDLPAPTPTSPPAPTVTATASKAYGDLYSTESLNVVPELAEEGEITGSAWVQVFPAAVTFRDIDTDFSDGQAIVQGQLTAVDLDRINREEAEGFNDFLGNPLPGRPVEATVTEVTYEQIKTGERYDFIAKIVLPTYRYEERRRPLPGLQATTDADGRFTMTFAGSEDVTYEVELSTADDAGRKATLTTGVYGRFRNYYADEPYLATPSRAADPFGSTQNLIHFPTRDHRMPVFRRAFSFRAGLAW